MHLHRTANTKYEVLSKLKSVPDASGIIEGDEGKSDENESGNGKTNCKSCLLFVVHFSPSKYVKCNYCFVMEEKHLSDTERFMIKFNELKEENGKLKVQLDCTRNEMKEENENLTASNQQLRTELDAAKTTINTLVQNVADLTQSVQALRDRDEVKMQHIDLNLQNNWIPYNSTFAIPKATKIGNVVYLRGLIRGGSANTNIAILPDNWRPSRRRVFVSAQSNNKSCRIDVYPNGHVNLTGGTSENWICLDAVAFVVG